MTLFPLHFEIIVKEAERLNMSISTEEIRKLRKIAQQSKKILHVTFLYHLEWLKRNNLYKKDSPISVPDLKECLEETVSGILKLHSTEMNKKDENRNTIKKIYERYVDRNEVLTNTEKANLKKKLVNSKILEDVRYVTLLRESVEKMLSELQELLSQELKTMLEQMKSKSEWTDAQWIELRSPHILMTALTRVIDIEFTTKLLPDQLDKYEAKKFVVHLILKELVKQGKLFYCDIGSFYNSGHCWIKY